MAYQIVDISACPTLPIMWICRPKNCSLGLVTCRSSEKLIEFRNILTCLSYREGDVEVALDDSRAQKLRNSCQLHFWDLQEFQGSKVQEDWKLKVMWERTDGVERRKSSGWQGTCVFSAEVRSIVEYFLACPSNGKPNVIFSTLLTILPRIVWR